MATWKVIDIRFDPVSIGVQKYLRASLQRMDNDFIPETVEVYSDGIRGIWRCPLVSEEEIRKLIKNRTTITQFIFEHRKCEEEDCPCHEHYDPDYGCAGAAT
jgi:hypothetical protein